MFVPLVAGRWMPATRKDAGGVACHEHGAVFASAARAPLTSVASVVEMTGDFTLTLPVMLAVAIATATSRGLSYGTIYTTKLLRRGTDIDRVPSADPFEDLTAADAMRRFPAPLAAANGPPGVPSAGHPALPGPVTRQRSPQVLFGSESLTQAVRQLELYGRDGLPVISDDGQHLQGWLTSQNVLQAVARHISAAQAGAAQPPPAAGTAPPGRQDALHRAPAPLRGFKVLEIAITAGSPAAGRKLGDIAWPPGCIPVSVQDTRTVRDPDPGVILAPGDRVSLLARTQ
jgi:chloride channel protein, CIC family